MGLSGQATSAKKSPTMGRTTSTNLEANGELRILLIVTVTIGLLLMLSLLLCYACVLKRLCCGTPRNGHKHNAGRRTESYPMGDITLLSQPTESERV
ncbi:hypothetical protein NE865_09872 [Phthorimaea operculella]|nr:hypothetical protein NE865_09872 [Phthorimaea operculella]